ncbi:unnamed protein product [Leuciscus chuanchicus]
MGVSRSGALVLAFLMMRENLTLTDAIIAVRLNRDIYPNSGFLGQLSGQPFEDTRKTHWAPGRTAACRRARSRQCKEGIIGWWNWAQAVLSPLGQKSDSLAFD